MAKTIKAESKNTSAKELLFTEKRILVNGCTAKPVPISDKSLRQSMTMNEKMKSYGYMLKPEDVIEMAKYPVQVMQDLLDDIEKFTDKVPADPMYKDFPNEVMAMDEAQYRMHQLLHYFSTYGLRTLFGTDVHKGWLPDEEGTEKVKEDKSLLKLKVLEVLPKYKAYEKALSQTLSKKTRMTIPEQELVMQILEELNADTDYGKNPLDGITIPFKENMEQIFASILFDQNLILEERVPLLHGICQNTGDVMKGLQTCLSMTKWHLKTSQKKTFVRLFESYPAADLAENLWLSKSKAEKAKRCLNEISYNKYAKDAEKKEVVKAARDNELTSFEARVKKVLAEDPKEAAEMASSRPGWFLRMLTLFYRNGVPKEDLSVLLNKGASKLSAATLVSILNSFSDKINELNALKMRTDEQEKKLMECRDIFDIVKDAMEAHFETVDTKIRNKKVFVDPKDFALDYSRPEGNEKSADGGYFASGMAYKIPKNAKHVRFFVYWNDEERVDVDLHAYAMTKDGDEIHVGWNGDFRQEGIVMSGDITHSDAAEYIDLDMKNKDLSRATMYVRLYYGRDGFDGIQTCYAGLMAVNELGEDVKLYSPKNCFVSNELRQHERAIWYGYIDIPNRVLIYAGQPDREYHTPFSMLEKPLYSMADYIEMLIASQNAVFVNDKDEADVILTFGKSETEQEISIIDENFFMEA